jgi:hypothetical protein
MDVPCMEVYLLDLEPESKRTKLTAFLAYYGSNLLMFRQVI